MATSRRGLISFCQLRKTAIAHRQVSTGGGVPDVPVRIDDVLLDLERRGDEAGSEGRIEVCLALLEWQRVSGMESHVDETLAFLADELVICGFVSLALTMTREYGEEAFAALTNWLIRYIGEKASMALQDLNNASRRKRKSFSRCIAPAAILLHTLSAMARLPSDYYQVIALEMYIRACVDHNITEVIEECCRFRNMVILQTRMYLLQYDAKLQRKQQHLESIYSPPSQQHLLPRDTFNKIILSVRRDHVLEDTLAFMRQEEISLADSLHIHFEDEEGEDAGGLIKEWLLLLCRSLIPQVLLSKENEAKHYVVKAHCAKEEAELLGVILGLALMNNIAIDVPLATYAYRYMLEGDGHVTLEDLIEVQPGVARGIQEMLQWSAINFTQKLSTNFCYTSDDGIIVPLIEDGEKTPITLANRSDFVERFCKARLVEERLDTMMAIRDGFERVWRDTSALQLFPPFEVSQLICGQEVECTVDFLKAHCTVDCQSSKDRIYVETFWEVLRSLDELNSVKQLLLFVTANSRLPLCYTKTIFHIVILQGEDFASRLPTASICTNTLFLPVYHSKDTLRVHLGTALRLGVQGFGLK